MLLYVTADRIGAQSGGGVVTFNELEALKTLGDCTVTDREWLEEIVYAADGDDPWKWDNRLIRLTGMHKNPATLAHFYAGTFTKTIELLQGEGTKITYTAAAHDIDRSRREHNRLGLKFDYPHLTDPVLWKRYVKGYLDADLVICPSEHSAECMRSYGCERVKIIPHGVDIPEGVHPLPSQFAVGYMGAIGPDKGLIYLLQAWKKLAYKDAVLILAGSQSNSPFMFSLLVKFGGGNIATLGWVPDIADFFKRITLYCQPSCTEGFGIEVLEAMAHGRIAIASEGCGASDAVPAACKFKPADVDDLADLIDHARKEWEFGPPEAAREHVSFYSWKNIRAEYVKTWQNILGPAPGSFTREELKELVGFSRQDRAKKESKA